MKPPAANLRARESGFTLLEILVAVVLLGLLVIGLTQGVRTGVNLWTAQARRSAETAELDATARVLRNVLTSIPVLAAAASGTAPVPIGFKGEPNRIVLVGELPTGFGSTQRADITIELNLGRVVISWVPHRHENPSGAAPVPVETELIAKVEDLQFAYWGPAAPNSPAAWLPQWDLPGLPGLIRVRVRLPKGDLRHWPDLVVASPLWTPSG